MPALNTKVESGAPTSPIDASKPPLGLIDADAYHRVAAVENVRASNLLSGRALETEEIERLFEICAADGTAKGARDAAMLAVFYGCGLRRGELACLDLDDFDIEDSSIRFMASAANSALSTSLRVVGSTS